MHRRTFLAALASAPLLSFARVGAGAQAVAAPRVEPRPRCARDDARRSASTTRRSPRPAPGTATTRSIVFVPAHYRWREPRRASPRSCTSTGTTRPPSGRWSRTSFASSSPTASRTPILVVPQLAVMSADSSCGKLEAPGGLAATARRGRRDGRARGARRRSGDTAFPADAPARHGLPRRPTPAATTPRRAACAAGGVDVRETYLFDALYADVDVFRDWVVAGTASRSTGATSS